MPSKKTPTQPQNPQMNGKSPLPSFPPPPPKVIPADNFPHLCPVLSRGGTPEPGKAELVMRGGVSRVGFGFFFFGGGEGFPAGVLHAGGGGLSRSATSYGEKIGFFFGGGVFLLVRDNAAAGCPPPFSPPAPGSNPGYSPSGSF